MPKKTAIIFTVLAHFALNWSLLIPYYYPIPHGHETLLPSACGFLLIYVGVLLRREAYFAAGVTDNLKLGKIGELSLWFLAAIAFQPTLEILKATQSPIVFEKYYGRPYVTCLGTAMIVLGYFFVWEGMRMLYAHHRNVLPICVLFGVILGIYSGIEIWFTVWYLLHYHEHPEGLEMADTFKYGLAGIKIIFTATFLALIWFRPGQAPSTPKTIWEILGEWYTYLVGGQQEGPAQQPQQ
jgi:hypothetical protein